MGWELRGGKRFYYRKEKYRDASGRSRVRSIYCGSGERGEAAAREDEERRRGASLSMSEPCATGESRHIDERETRPHAAPPTVVMQRCNSGAADPPTRAEEFGELLRIKDDDPPAAHWRSLKPPAPAAYRRRYRPAPFSDKDPNRYYVPPPRRRRP